MKVWQGWFLGESCFPGLQMAAFLPCSLMVYNEFSGVSSYLLTNSVTLEPCPYVLILTLIISIKALSPNTVTWWEWGFNIMGLAGTQTFRP